MSPIEVWTIMLISSLIVFSFCILGIVLYHTKRDDSSSSNSVSSASHTDWKLNTRDKRLRFLRSMDYHPIKINMGKGTACYISQSDPNKTYNTSLKSCTCPDFVRRHEPCKHMYALAIELGVVDKDTPLFVLPYGIEQSIKDAAAKNRYFASNLYDTLNVALKSNECKKIETENGVYQVVHISDYEVHGNGLTCMCNAGMLIFLKHSDFDFLDFIVKEYSVQDFREAAKYCCPTVKFPKMKKRELIEYICANNPNIETYIDNDYYHVAIDCRYIENAELIKEYLDEIYIHPIKPINVNEIISSPEWEINTRYKRINFLCAKECTLVYFNKAKITAHYKKHMDTSLIYKTSLTNCTCSDFKYGNTPCEHMYALAIELGLVDKDTPLFVLPDGVEKQIKDAVAQNPTFCDDLYEIMKMIPKRKEYHEIKTENGIYRIIHISHELITINMINCILNAGIATRVPDSDSLFCDFVEQNYTVKSFKDETLACCPNIKFPSFKKRELIEYICSNNPEIVNKLYCLYDNYYHVALDCRYITNAKLIKEYLEDMYIYPISNYVHYQHRD